MPTITLYSLGNQQELEVPDGCTVENAISLAELSPDIEVRFRGQSVPQEERGDVVVNDGDALVASPPPAKHG